MSHSHRPRVLLVEDDEDVGLVLHRTLYQDRDLYDVLLAPSAERALSLLAEVRVDVLVTDLRLPHMNGLDLLKWAQWEAPQMRAVVITASDVEGIRDRAHASGCVRVLRKPFDGDELRMTVRQAIENRGGIAGSLRDLSFADLVQSLCLARRTAALRVVSSKDSGAVYLERGDVVNATFRDLVGEEAFYAMLALQDGRFCTTPLPTDVARIAMPGWQHLLLEGTRRLDEGCPPTLSSAGTPPGAARGPGAREASEISRLIDEGFERLRAGQRDDARFAWEHALELDPSNKTVELNLRRLGSAATANRL